MKGWFLRKLTSVFTENHISYRELICARGLLEGIIVASDITGCGVFTVAQEVI